MITGNSLKNAILSGANNIVNNRRLVDELNVFPVPDGDTGTNMSMSIMGAARELSRLQNEPVDTVADTAASALLRGARGNSGVILSLLFRGFAKGFKGCTEAGGEELVSALEQGVEAAYKAVMKPTEGTILTVARLAAEGARAKISETDDPVVLFETAVACAEVALENTPELLPVLKKAGVVDAGGKGLVVIFTGMLSVFRDNVMIEAQESEEKAPAPISAGSNFAAQSEEEITFTYCTEFIIKRADKKDPLTLRAYLESIGDCVVVVEDDQIIKVHVHTEAPGKAITKALTFGALINMKIDNMRDQHERQKAEQELTTTAVLTPDGGEYTPVAPENEYGFVAVAAGSGLHGLFTDLGADNVVSGGQTMNPSTDDLLRAIELTPAKTVFVLPNNKNIIMAAEQAVPLASRNVVVLHTRSIPMGISAMLAFDPDIPSEENVIAMDRAMNRIGTGQVTFAARDSDYDGHKIKAGELLALENGKVAFVETDINKAVTKLIKSLYKKDSSFITIIHGSDVSAEDAEVITAAIAAKYPSAEVTLINGGQPVYYFILSVE